MVSMMQIAQPHIAAHGGPVDGGIESSLAETLDDPIVALLMRREHVSRRDVAKLASCLKAVLPNHGRDVIVRFTAGELTVPEHPAQAGAAGRPGEDG